MAQRDKLIQQFVKKARTPIASINRPGTAAPSEAARRYARARAGRKIPSDPGMRAAHFASPAMTQRKRPKQPRSYSV